MRKRYNYFDDDEEVIRQIRERRSKESRDTDTPADADTSSAPDHYSAAAVHNAAMEAVGIAKRTGRAAARVARAGRDRIVREESRAPRRLAVVVCLLMVVLTIVGTVSVVSININRDINHESRFNTSAGELCNQYASKYGNCNYESLQSKGIDGYCLTGVCCVRQIDFNNDNDGELLICYRDRSTYYVEVWGFKGKKFDMLYKDKLCQSKDKKDDVWLTLYFHNGRYYIGQHDEGKHDKVTLHTLHGGRFRSDGTCTYDELTGTFTIDKEVNTEDFERVKMSVMRENAAALATDNVNDAIAAMATDDDHTNKKKVTGINAAYYNIVRNMNEKYGVAEYHSNPGRAYVSGLAVVKMIDFDHDGTDELLTIYRRAVSSMGTDREGNYQSEAEEKYFAAIYAWNGKVATQVYSCEDLCNSITNDTDIYYIIRKDGNKRKWCINHFNSENYGRVVQATSKTFSFTGETFTLDKKAYYETRYGYTEYYLNDTWASKSKFAENGGFSVPFFDGGTSYDEDRYIVTYLQTKSANQNAVKRVVQDTEDTIKRLDNTYDPDDVVTGK